MKEPRMPARKEVSRDRLITALQHIAIAMQNYAGSGCPCGICTVIRNECEKVGILEKRREK